MSTEKEEIRHADKTWVMVLGDLDVEVARQKLIEAGVDGDTLVVEKGDAADLWQNPDVVFHTSRTRFNDFTYARVPEDPITLKTLVEKIADGQKAQSAWLAARQKHKNLGTVAQCRLPMSALTHPGFQVFLSECARGQTQIIRYSTVQSSWSKHPYNTVPLVADITTRKFGNDPDDDYSEVSGQVTFEVPVTKLVIGLGDRVTKNVTHVVVMNKLEAGMPDSRCSLPQVPQNSYSFLATPRSHFERKLHDDLRLLLGIDVPPEDLPYFVRSETVVRDGTNRYVYLVKFVVRGVGFSQQRSSTIETAQILPLQDAVLRLHPEDAGLLYVASNL